MCQIPFLPLQTSIFHHLVSIQRPGLILALLPKIFPSRRVLPEPFCLARPFIRAAEFPD
jgi:hypothetical protein